jgi:ABC-type transporter MlaC component
MVWQIWRGLFGGGVVALSLVTPAAISLAQTAAQTPVATAPDWLNSTAAAAKAVKIPTINVVIPAPAPAPAVKVAVTRPAAPAKKLAEAPKKPEPTKKIVAAKKPAEPKKLAAADQLHAEPTKLAATPPKPPSPSYTVTTTNGNVTYTTTHTVTPTTNPAPRTATATPPPPSAQAPVKPPAIIPVSLTEPVRTTPAPVPQKPIAERPATPAQLASTSIVPVSLTEPVKTVAAPVPVAQKPVAEKPLATAPTTPAAPPDSKSATVFVSKFLTDAFHIAKLNGATSLQRRAQLADLFAGKMDVKRIAGYTTADELTGASTDMQNRFRTILVSYLVETYYPQLELAADPSVTVETAAAQPLPDGTAVVWTIFTKTGWGAQSIQWHLAAENGGLKIVDIFSAGASLVQMERDTFQSVMRNGGLSELMAKLDARTRELASAATE